MASTGLLNWFKMNWGATRLISFKTLLGPVGFLSDLFLAL
jgi:hypothetical protein